MANVTVVSGIGTTVPGSVYSELPATLNSVLQSLLYAASAADVVSVAGAVTATAVQALVVNAPGASTIIGSSTGSLVVLGSGSNVTFSVAGGAGSIFAAGGADSIVVGALLSSSTYNITGTGNVTANLLSGFDTLTALSGSNDLIYVNNALATVVGTGNATVAVTFAQNSGGTLDFINNSNQQATVFTGAFTTAGGQNIYAVNSVTISGGAGGGFYVGGLAGNNSLVGGSGVVTLVGGGNNDFLEANSSLATNVLFGGPGVETLIGSALTGANDFDIGLKYDGLGTVAGIDIVSTSGTGTQDFAIGAGSFTITGSTAVLAGAGLANVYDVIRGAGLSGANITITDFGSHDAILFTDTTESAGTSHFNTIGADGFGGTQITLTDHTVVDLVGIGPSSFTTLAGANGVIGVLGK